MALSILTRTRARAGSASPRVLLVGRCPPPYGGITVHIQRLQRNLAVDCRVAVFDPYPRPRRRDGQVDSADEARVVRAAKGSMAGAFLAYARLLAGSRFYLVHFHVAAMRRFVRFGLPLLALARLFGARCVLTVHSGSLGADRQGFGARLMLRGLLALCHRVVAVSREQQAFLVGALGLDPGRLTVIPAFLPPPVASTSRFDGRLAAWRDAGFQVLCSSGGGSPVYGFHVLLDALRRVSGELRCGLVLAIGDRGGDDYVQSLIASAGDLPLIVSRDLPPEELAWVVQSSDLYLRCTDQDGDSLAIREALFLGTPVVASDCVARPPGVEIFTTNDAADLARAILAANRAGPVAEPPSMPDCAGELREVYGLARRDLASFVG